MKSARYIRFINFNGFVGSSPFLLYNENNAEIGTISFKGSSVEINGKNYIVIGNINEESEAFTKEFYSDKYIVNE